MNVTLKLLAFQLWHSEHVSIAVPERAFFSWLSTAWIHRQLQASHTTAALFTCWRPLSENIRHICRGVPRLNVGGKKMCLTSPTARWTQLTPKNLFNLTVTESNDHPKLLVWKFCSCTEAAFNCRGESLHIFISLVWNHVFLITQRAAEEMPWPPSQIHSWTATKSRIGLKVFKEQNFLIWRCASWDSQALRPAETASICVCLQRAPVRSEEFLSFEQRIPSLNGLYLCYPRCFPLLFRFPSWLCSIWNLHFDLIWKCTNGFQTECHVWFG